MLTLEDSSSGAGDSETVSHEPRSYAGTMYVIVKGLGAARTRFDISRSRGISRFVGRTADLRTLADALERSDSGAGQVVVSRPLVAVSRPSRPCGAGPSSRP